MTDIKEGGMMIKIKDYIFNGNEIHHICKRYTTKLKELYIYFNNGHESMIIQNATLEDIEWNYGTQKRTQEHTIGKGVCDKNKKPLLTIEDIQLYIQELEEENKKLKESIVNLIKDDSDLQLKINKAIEYIGIDNSILDDCNIYDVNGIEIYKILKGE